MSTASTSYTYAHCNIKQNYLVQREMPTDLNVFFQAAFKQLGLITRFQPALLWLRWHSRWSTNDRINRHQL